MHVGALPGDAQLPIAIGVVRASIAASAMHPSISLLDQPDMTRFLVTVVCATQRSWYREHRCMGRGVSGYFSRIGMIP